MILAVSSFEWAHCKIFIVRKAGKVPLLSGAVILLKLEINQAISGIDDVRGSEVALIHLESAKLKIFMFVQEVTLPFNLSIVSSSLY